MIALWIFILCCLMAFGIGTFTVQMQELRRHLDDIYRMLRDIKAK